MNQAKEQGYSVYFLIFLIRFILVFFYLNPSEDGGNQDCKWNRKFDQRTWQSNDIQNTKCQSDTMSDGKCGDQNQPIPVPKTIHTSKNQQKQHMVVSGQISDMLKARLKP